LEDIKVSLRNKGLAKDRKVLLEDKSFAKKKKKFCQEIEV